MKTNTKIMCAMMLGASLMFSSQFVSGQAWDLNGNTNATSNSILGATGAGINLRLFAGNEAIRILGSNGNVKIGTPGTAPTAKLHVQGTTRLQGNTTVNGLTTTTTIKITGGGPGLNKILRSDAAGLATWVAASSVFTETDPQVGVLGTNNVPRWDGSALVGGTITDNATNVGIGTLSPTQKLHVVGNILATGNLIGANIDVAGHVGFGSFEEFTDGGAATIASNSNIVPLTDCGRDLGTTTNRWGNIIACGNITTVGNIGIGITAPTEKLQVAGNIESTTGDLYTSSGNGVINSGGGIQHPLVNIIGDDTLGFSTSGCDGDEDLYIDGELAVMGGARKPGGGSWIATSDARLKRDVKPYTDGLEKLLQVNPVNFKYIKELNYNDNDKEYTGIIAQEMQKIAPYMIAEEAMGKQAHEDENGNVVIDNPGSKFLTYDGTALTYMLVNAVKEQNQTIESLKAEIAELKAQYNSSDKNASSLGSYENARLEQNIPNPFSEETTIHYYLPSNSTAVLKVMSLDGKEMLSAPVTKTGYGEVRISGSTMAAGTYTYTLLVNGKAVESKIMVLTK